MNYCYCCGSKLVLKECNNDGLVPFCEKCNEFRFPIFNTAVSMVVLNPSRDKTLFIKQYGKGLNWLVAGYVNKTESAEDACRRELFEEVGLFVENMYFQKSMYFSKTNTLVFNYVVICSDMNVICNEEVDEYNWYSLDEGMDMIARGGLAFEFYKMFYEGVKNEV